MTERRRFAAFGIAARFMRDRSGAYAVMIGLMAPIFIGAVTLGTETGLWYKTQEKMQGAADSAAISAALGLIGGDTNVTLEANATAASNGFVNGSSGTVVTVNKPPLSGPNTGTAGAVEVIIKQPQKLLFSSLFLKSPVVVQARGVAGAIPEVVCVLALNKSLLLPGITVVAAAAVEADRCNIADNSPSPLALTEAALASITAQKVNVVGGYVDVLGSMTTTEGVHTGSTPTQDPFAGTTVPALVSSIPCNVYSNSTYGQITGPVTLSPGRYCGGIKVKAGTVTLSAGTYYLDLGFLGTGLAVASGATVTDSGAGVTIVITSSGLLSNILSVDIGGLLSGGVINLTAPTSGSFANLVVFVDPGALLSVPTFRGGTQNSFVGTIYAPGSKVVYALGSGTKTGQCTRLIAETIIFGLTGASFSKCAVTSASAAAASLLE
ncbi:MAG: pilus assembly protein TadG-related protein [Methylocella sp.]